MDFSEILNLKVFGLSISWIVAFCLKAAVIYTFVRIVTALVKYFFKRSMERQGKIVVDKTTMGFVRQIVVAVVYIIGVAAFLSLIPGMEKVSSSILASAGIGAMAVGLASQEALSNIVGGLFIIFSKPFKVGDYIMVDSTVTGTVMEISLRHTVIRNSENRMILVPNKTMNTSTVVNSSYGDPATCTSIAIGVSYDTNLDHAIASMRDEIMRHPLLIDRRSDAERAAGAPQVVVRVTALGDSAITLCASAWSATTGNAYAMKCDLLKSIKERFDREGIEIPYPYFNQIVKS